MKLWSQLALPPSPLPKCDKSSPKSPPPPPPLGRSTFQTQIRFMLQQKYCKTRVLPSSFLLDYIMYECSGRIFALPPPPEKDLNQMSNKNVPESISSCTLRSYYSTTWLEGLKVVWKDTWKKKVHLFECNLQVTTCHSVNFELFLCLN